jgi:hypothetical protein
VLPTIIGVVSADSVTVATGAALTVIELVPVFVSLVAVTVAVPTAKALTNPFASTVATAVLLDIQLAARPVRMLPLASFVTTVSCCVGVSTS